MRRAVVLGLGSFAVSCSFAMAACGSADDSAATTDSGAASDATTTTDATLSAGGEDGAAAADDATVSGDDSDATLDAGANAMRDARVDEFGDADADADAGPYRLCPAAKYPDDGGWVVTHGFDVSEYEYVDWDAATANSASYKYAFARATAGNDHVDTQFSRDWKEMKRVGLVRGAYHYFHAEEYAAGQATEFIDEIAAVGGLTPTDLPPVLDMEDDVGMPAETIACRLKGWLTQVETKTGRVPMIFTLQKYNYVFDESFGHYTLWTTNFVSNPLVTCARMLTSWTRWIFWQWSATATVPGIYANANTGGSGSIETSGGKPVLSLADLDYFDGTLADLTAFAPTTVSSSPPAAYSPPASPPQVLADAGTMKTHGTRANDSAATR